MQWPRRRWARHAETTLQFITGCGESDIVRQLSFIQTEYTPNTLRAPLHASSDGDEQPRQPRTSVGGREESLTTARASFGAGVGCELCQMVAPRWRPSEPFGAAFPPVSRARSAPCPRRFSLDEPLVRSFCKSFPSRTQTAQSPCSSCVAQRRSSGHAEVRGPQLCFCGTLCQLLLTCTTARALSLDAP